MTEILFARKTATDDFQTDLDALEVRQDAVDAAVTAIDARVDAVEAVDVTLDTRLDTIESTLASTIFITFGASAGTGAERAISSSTSILLNTASVGALTLERAAVTGDIAISQNGNTATLPNVNSNTGAFGSHLAAPTITVNAKGQVTAVSSTTNTPIVLLFTGQSNMVQVNTLAYGPASNGRIWNFDGVTTHVGTAFQALSATAINLAEKIVSDVAYANPDRMVYGINVSFGSQPISHWMTGATSPDVWADIVANIVPALALIGVTRIDGLFWWQGENQTSTPWTYVDDFNTVMNRFKALNSTWYPRGTPVIVFGLASTSQSTDPKSDVSNSKLMEAVRAEGSVRRFVHTDLLESTYWADTLHPNAAGFFIAGQMASNAWMSMSATPATNNVTKFLAPQAIGRPAQRNLIVGGDFMTNRWRYGTSFAAAADGLQIADNWYWRQTGAGVATIRQASDAPTVAQAGMYTANSLDVEVTTADASIGSTDLYVVEHAVDALSASFMGFGQTAGLTLTIPFWVKNSITGNYFVYLSNSARNRTYTSQYTITTANTWELKWLTFTADTTGTWLYTSGVGMYIGFVLAAGDTYLFTPEVWNGGDVRVGNATRANAMSTIGNHFKLALVQAAEGFGPSAYEVQPYRFTATGDDIAKPTALSVQNSGSTNDSSSGSGAYINHTPNFVLPANYLASGKALRITAHFRITTGAVAPTLSVQLKAGTTVLAQLTGSTPTALISNNQYGLTFVVQAIAAIGAAANVEATLFGNSNSPGGVAVGSDTDMPVALATNTALTLQMATQWGSAGTGVNTIILSQLIVEPIN